MEFHFEPVWSWTVTTLMAAGLIAFVLITYPSRVAHLPKFWRRGLIGLRLATALVLIFAMFRPVISWTDKDDDSAVVAILADSSRSLATKDGKGGISRRQHLLEVLKESKPLLNRLADQVDLRTYDFSDDIIPVTEFEDKAEGIQTRMGVAIKQLTEDTRGKKLAAIFLLGDGAERILTPESITPELSARNAAQAGTAIYTTPFGSTTSASTAVDLALEDLLVEPVVFERKTIPVNVKLRANGAIGKTLEVRLWVENRIGKKPGETGELTPVPMNHSNRSVVRVKTDQASDIIPIELTYTPAMAGEFLLAVEVKAIDDEVLLRNNKLQTLITVRKGGLKVAYFDALRNEVKYIRRINQSKKIQIDFQLVFSGEFEDRTKIPETWFQPGAYDVYIIGDVPASAFGNKKLRLLAKRIREDGAGLMMLGGYHTYGAGGYASSPIASLIPIEMRAAEKQPDDKLDMTLQKTGDLNITPTQAGLRHYVMRLASPNKTNELWKSLPTMSIANRMKPIDDFVEILATTNDEAPVLISSETGRARIVVSALSETYLWAASGNHKTHQRFWRQMILWLAHKEFDSDQPVWVRIHPTNFPPKSPVTIEMGAQTEKGLPIRDAKFDVEIINPQGDKQLLAATASKNHSLADFRKTALPGMYWVKVNAKKDNSSISLPAHARFIIDDRDLELDNPAVDIGQLKELSRIAAETTDSQMIPPEKFQSFLREFLKRKSWQTDLEKATRVSLWDGWILLLTFIGLLTLEWFLRKRWNLV